jgi:hypothetical protein
LDPSNDLDWLILTVPEFHALLSLNPSFLFTLSRCNYICIASQQNMES